MVKKMAVPKKRTGAAAQAKRRANWKATKPTTTKCTHCGEVVLTHTVCTACGYYKGKAVSIKSPDYVATPIESAKKPAVKKAPAKKTKKAEVKVEEAKVEEAKVEETVEVLETEVKAETVETEAEKTEE
jgi:large subunit ribosomal protein L32